MKKALIDQLPVRYGFITLFSGLSLLTITLIAEAYARDMPLNLASVTDFYLQNPVLSIFTLALIVAVSMSYWLGVQFGQQLLESYHKLDQQKASIDKVVHFAELLRDGNIEAQYEQQDQNDTLGKTLVELRDQLSKNLTEEAQRKSEESQRHWVATGIAQFSDILRHNVNDIRKLAQEVVSFLVKYMNTNQAGFYNLVGEQNESYFQLVAIYAFGRDKYPDQRLAWGEGLVGASALEKETIYMTEIPDSYITITSGLGESNPRSILIVPLQYNDEVHGVLEMAAFHTLEPYQIRFVERIAENVASTLASVKTNEQTAKLLHESQKATEKMAQQEEIMRQNMIELEATQIEAAKQSEEFISFSNSVNRSMLRAEFDLEGNLMVANEKFMKTLGLVRRPNERIHVSTLIERRKLDWFERYWIEITTQSTYFEGEIPFTTTDFKPVWTTGAFTSVANIDDVIEKVLFLGLDVTEQKSSEQQNKALIEAINQATLKVEFDINGSITLANEKMMKLLRYSFEEVKRISIQDFVLEDQKRNFKTIWQNISRGIPFEGRVGMKNRLDERIWFFGTFSLISSATFQSAEKIVFIGSDITRQMEMEEKSKLQTKKLIEQEEQLRSSREDLSRRLREAKEEMRGQYKEIEIVKALSEKTLEGTLDAIVSINQFGKIEFFNEAAEELWGTTKDQVLGRQIEEILPPQHEIDEEEYMGKYLRITDEPVLRQRTEVFLITQLGQRENVLLTLSEAKEGEHYRLTGFIQKVEVELF